VNSFHLISGAHTTQTPFHRNRKSNFFALFSRFRRSRDGGADLSLWIDR
jgi:hypothetical protein